MRLPTLQHEELTPRQRESWDKHSARRETVRGPYTVWLHDPDLMDKVSDVSNYFRFDCGLPTPAPWYRPNGPRRFSMTSLGRM